jgi:transposase
MRYIKGLTTENLKILERIYRESKYYQVRQRVHGIRLSYEGHKISELMRIFAVSRNTIYNWFNNWDKFGLAGLYNEKGRGGKSLFNSQQKAQVKIWAKEEPRQLNPVLEKVEKEWGIQTSKKTVKRILTTLRMSWHRMRKAVGGQPNPEEYQQKKAQLEEFKQLEDEGKIDLYYLDEVGFNLIPCVPYGWQNVGEYLAIQSRHSRHRLNVLGIMNRQNHWESYVSIQTINSDVVIACIDAFFPTVNKPTVIVVDQSSIHTSDAILNKLEEWSERQITIFELPTYSQRLNLIEILWRFIKYEWLEIDAYASWETFVASVEKILREFGEKYTINFV